MDCIFKIHGYVPKNHLCLSCEPLEALFRSAGCSKKEASGYSEIILRAFRTIKFDDAFRDEAVHTKLIAKTLSILTMARLPKTIKDELKSVNLTIRRLENSKIGAAKYVEEVTKLGGSIFEDLVESSGWKKTLRSMGSTLTGAIIVEDMKKDLSNDLKEGKFNPLAGCNGDYVESLAKQRIAEFKRLANPVLATKPMAPEKTGVLSKLVRLVVKNQFCEDEPWCWLC